ncbi:transcription initiation factor TFIID subunit 3 [Cimex lectularius]|uniref:PHD-type domain-containing protein n=1 Tax=Cimex lectularius TaxID=79782 RepID=A0A8I6SNP9_CIMLE|nr:transcription initiation factor TFIID subunit 3 [Cimex lectularius]
MSEEFGRHILRKCIAQICQVIGWNSIHSTPLEILTDLLQQYIQGIARLSNNYAALYGQTEPNLDHLGLAFSDIKISINDLQEYVKFIDTTCVAEIPVYPIPRESHLNMLKPGSREVVTRPVHIHEHLPPMHPQLEDANIEDYSNSNTKESQLANEAQPMDSSSPLASPKTGVFKRPGDPLSSDGSSNKRRSVLMDDEIRPLREISSVMMTTSGFLSPAREGKLPEARTISIPIEHENEKPASIPESHPPSSSPQKVTSVSPPEAKVEKKKKHKSCDSSKKIDKENKSKEENLPYSPPKEDESKIKKVSTSVKEMKALKAGAVKVQSSTSSKNDKKKIKQQSSPSLQSTPVSSRTNKAKSPKREKQSFSPTFKDLIDTDSNTFDEKLPSEPDKQKLNIFKKISKVKEEHDENKTDIDSMHEFRRIALDKTIEAVTQKSRKAEPKTVDTNATLDAEPNKKGLLSSSSFLNNSVEVTVSNVTAPRTPDIPKTSEHKKKKKDKHKETQDREKYVSSPKSTHFYDDLPNKVKTPDVDMNVESMLMPYHFYNFPPGPGLIPYNPLIPQMPMQMYPKNPMSPFANTLTKDIPHLPPSLTITPVNPPAPTVSSTNTLSSNTPSPTAKVNSAPLTSIQTPFSVENNKTLTPSAPSSSSSKVALSTSPSPQKQKKSHGKEKKLKNKLKKKKNKKEKNKSKDKSERKKSKLEKKDKNKEKSKQKKEKKEKKEKKKEKKDKKEKKKDKEQKENKGDGAAPLPKITVKLVGSSASAQTPPPETSHRKIFIKPVVKKDEPNNPLVMNTPENSVVKQKPNKSKHSGIVSHAEDEVTNTPSSHNTPQPSFQPLAPDPKPDNVDVYKVWICPACRGPDDGSPMIACDSCDMWFHWTCVGIQEAPESDWYCQKCLIKNDELIEKKKKHKKKKSQLNS